MTFEIHICTKNRREELRKSLLALKNRERSDARILVYDDGSTDGTGQMLQQDFPELTVLTNTVSRGYLYCRNQLLSQAQSEYVITLDDDASFASENPLEEIKTFFDANPRCGLMAFRIYWSTEQPESTLHSDKPRRARGFVGCGHAWRVSAWKEVCPYPEWFEFYGEETYASLKLFSRNWEIWYAPQILVHHRVNRTVRRKASDFALRYRRSLRADWFLYFMYYPLPVAFRLFSYSLAMQARKIVSRPQLIPPVLRALCDLCCNWHRVKKFRNPLCRDSIKAYRELIPAPIHWNPEPFGNKLT